MSSNLPAHLLTRLFAHLSTEPQGNYVKDLLCLGRDLADVIIVDNSPHSYIFQPENAVPISTFIDNMEDQVGRGRGGGAGGAGGREMVCETLECAR
jgi:hypothetical protein